MSEFERYMAKICKDDAVYWGTPVANEFGVLEYETPVEIKCFWKDEIRMIIDKNGKESISIAEIYVLQDIDDSGMIYQGKLADLTGGQQDDPRKVKKAFEMKRFIKTPSLRSGFNRKILL